MRVGVVALGGLQHFPSSHCSQRKGLGLKDTPSAKKAFREIHPPNCQVPVVFPLHVFVCPNQTLRWDLEWGKPLGFPALRSEHSR